MTEETFKAKYQRQSYPCPFGTGESNNITLIGDQSSGSLNFQNGFPTPYEVPYENGGKYITRHDMNAIGELASRNSFYRMCGGLNTFSQEFCHKIGGYPKGAVLDYVNNGKYFKVLSLRDNNKKDFTGKSSSFSDIEPWTIDNVWWYVLNQDTPPPEEDKPVHTVTVSSGNPGTFVVLGLFKAAKTGLLYISSESGSISQATAPAIPLSVGNNGVQSNKKMIGYPFVAVKNLQSSSPSTSLEFPDVFANKLNGWTPLMYGNTIHKTITHTIAAVGNAFTTNSISEEKGESQFAVQVTEGDNLFFCFVNGVAPVVPIITGQGYIAQTVYGDFHYTCYIYQGRITFSYL